MEQDYIYGRNNCEIKFRSSETFIFASEVLWKVLRTCRVFFPEENTNGTAGGICWPIQVLGNAITKNGILQIMRENLWHRVGAVHVICSLIQVTATMVDYKAYMVGAKFLLHTETYSMEENEVGLNIRVQYTLDDGGGHTPIVGEQEITVEYY